MTCYVDQCAKPVKSKGMCSMHATRVARTGTTEPGVRPAGRPDLAFQRRIQPGQPDECWEWQGQIASNGYGRLGRRWAHRLAWELANGRTVPPRLMVLHACDNPPCCNPRHLRVGTPWDNMQDAVLRGRTSHTVKTASLTEDEVRVIRRLRSDGAKRAALAATFGICERQVSRIVNGRAWSHV